MSNVSTEFTHDNIPDLPSGPDDNLPPQAGPQQPQQNFRQGDARPSAGIPKFETVAVRRNDGTYANVEYVSIITPGDNKAMPRHKVTDAIRQKYEPWYVMFRKGLESSAHGIPLEMFPRLTPAQVRHLKGINVFTVEDLANIADSNLHQIPMGATMKKDAALWLKSKLETDAVENANRENEALKDSLAMLERQNAEMAARFDALEAEKMEDKVEVVHAEPEPETNMAAALNNAVDKKRRGRPPKTEA